jgi:hypothetical protein
LKSGQVRELHGRLRQNRHDSASFQPAGQTDRHPRPDEWRARSSHDGTEYRLRLTSNGKLILTK